MAVFAQFLKQTSCVWGGEVGCTYALDPLDLYFTHCLICFKIRVRSAAITEVKPVERRHKI